MFTRSSGSPVITAFDPASPANLIERAANEVARVTASYGLPQVGSMRLHQQGRILQVPWQAGKDVTGLWLVDVVSDEAHTIAAQQLGSFTAAQVNDDADRVALTNQGRLSILSAADDFSTFVDIVSPSFDPSYITFDAAWRPKR